MDHSISLALDKTEPPIAYRTGVMTLDLSVIQRYPDPWELRIAFANRYGVGGPENILVTAGADEGIDRVCRAFLMSKDAELVTFTPTFEMIAHYAALAGARVRNVDWLGGSFPLKEFVAQITDRTRLIVIVSPNNPSGSFVASEIIVSIARQFPDIPLLVDLAYIEFAASDPTRELASCENVIVVRTLSKAYGLPGLRIGCAIGAPKILQQLAACGGPYSVASLSISIALSALHDDLSCREYVKRVIREREEFSTLLATLAIKHFKSEANFILLHTLDAARFDQTLKESGINSRAFSQEPRLHGMRRLTMPGEAKAFEHLRRIIALATKSITNTTSPSIITPRQ